MGGSLSTKKSAGSDDRQKIRAHEQEMAKDNEANEAILDGDPRRDVHWYHWVIFDMRFRIVYATLLAMAIGVGVTLLLYLYVFSGNGNQKFGSCLLNSEFRFECMINSNRRDISEKDCFEAFGCYTDDDTLPFKCHHSFPPGYQYEVTQIRESSGDTSDTNTIDVTLTVAPRHPTNMLQLSVNFDWTEDGYLEMELFDAARRKSVEPTTKALNDNDHFVVSFPPESEFFYIHIQRKDTLETIFDTRMGPVIIDETSLSFSTTLATEFFWGLKGGQQELTTHVVLNGPGSSELPFYMALEQSGKFHGVLIETLAPFIFQYIEAPAMLFHFQDEASVKLRFFPGPTPQDVFTQVQKYKEKVAGIPAPVPKVLPPYWALGLHLCRKGYDAGQALAELKGLAAEGNDEKRKQIPYDSDCIEETLRKPFVIDDSTFPSTGSGFSSILDHIVTNGQKILLSQTMPLDAYPQPPTSVPLILDATGAAAFVGLQAPRDGNLSEGIEIVFPDYLNSQVQAWADAELSAGLSGGFRPDVRHLMTGLVLVDNFPSTENSSRICGRDSGISSLIGSRFTDANLICANTKHSNTSFTTGSTSHLSVHNVYGQEALRVLRTSFESWMTSTNQRIPVIGASVWSGLGSEDGFTGGLIPFTWSGLLESVYQIVGNFVLNPTLVGTPICGSYIQTDDSIRALNKEIDDDELSPEELARQNGDTLCLRWFQFGLLLPFARNTRTINGTLGPLDLSLKSRNYLIESVQNRYRFNPYYYTQLYLGQLTPTPLIRPLIYDFHSESEVNSTREVLTQFMIGNALMAAPIVSEALSRDVYFPAGTWYDIHGNMVSDSSLIGRTFTVPSLLAEIPLYIRGGYIVPVLHEPVEPTAEESRGGKYRILATFPTGTTTASSGSLYIDDGVSADSISTENFNYATFECTPDQFTITSDACKVNNPKISTTIDEIKIIGFPYQLDVDSIEIVEPGTGLPQPTPKQSGDAEETGSLRIIMTPGFDWCDFRQLTFRWIYK